MFKNKHNLIILVLGLVFVLSGCFHKVDKSASQDIKKSVVNEIKEDTLEGYMAEDQKKEFEEKMQEKEKYKGIITKKEGGLKKYRNEYFGFEFEFEDKNDEISIYYESSSGIALLSKDAYIYIYIYRLSSL